MSVLAQLRTVEGLWAIGVGGEDAVTLYSWAEVSEWLRTAMGDDIPEVNRDIALADAAVKLACRARATHREVQVRRLLEVA
ncbi:hypothetical protein [Nonomuraea sp. NPDC005501]|uniref:hypothetical protein n=1 Tax=Nonomuraea sp. NPDC005501 TaxID=3156884 RepID=UPI0033AC5E69